MIFVLFDVLEARGQSVRISRVTSMTNSERCSRRSDSKCQITIAGVRLNKSNTVTTN